MDREILFRGKRLDNGEWAEGHFITDEQDASHAYIGYLFGVNGSVVHDTDIVEVIPYTICQYTNYADIREHKAFEHDIVFYEDGGCYGRIIFKDGQFLIEWKSRDDLRNDIHFWFTKRRVHVVGNVFDNFGLLDGGSE